MEARVIPWRIPPAIHADLSEALDAIDFVEAALIETMDARAPTGLQLSALAIAGRLRRKHGRRS